MWVNQEDCQFTDMVRTPFSARRLFGSRRLGAQFHVVSGRVCPEFDSTSRLRRLTTRALRDQHQRMDRRAGIERCRFSPNPGVVGIPVERRKRMSALARGHMQDAASFATR